MDPEKERLWMDLIKATQSQMEDFDARLMYQHQLVSVLLERLADGARTTQSSHQSSPLIPDEIRDEAKRRAFAAWGKAADLDNARASRIWKIIEGL